MPDLFANIFFAVMLQSKIAQFNIKLVPSCWYSEESLMIAEKVFEKSIQLIENENQLKQTGTFHIINTIRGQDVYSGSVNIWIKKRAIWSWSWALQKSFKFSN